MISADKIDRASIIIHDVVSKTPLIRNYNLSKKYQCNIYLKREDMQVVRSFKIRGAYHKMKTMDKDAMARGVICASAGNHAQGVAFACSALNINGIRCSPTTTPRQKITEVKHLDGERIAVRLMGDTFHDSNTVALRHQAV